ncbi:MAG TPA: MATE family efflux transporter [Clostridiaceae bacterium]|nr:MATE family efflux transporter [Clostridiaceae bacterium]
MDRIKETLKKYVFSGKSFYVQLFTIALPIIIQNFIGSCLNMVDTVMIGQVGESQIAAVGIANQYFLLFVLFIIGIHSGCGVFISQFWGKGDRDNIRKVLGIGLVISSIVALIFTVAALLFPEEIISIFREDDPLVISEGAAYLRIVCISYIFNALSFGYAFASRSIGNAFMPMVISALALGCNTVFNYILIFGNMGAPVLGVRGAAIATLIARIFETVLIIAWIYISRNVLAVSLKDIPGITRKFIANVTKTMIPVVLNETCWGLAYIIYSVAYGRIGTQAIAAVQICNTVVNIFTVAIFGIAAASSVMIGHKIGENEEEEARTYAWRFSILSVIGGLITGVVLAAGTPAILSLFNVSSEVHNSAKLILYITSLVMIIRFFNIVLIVGILRGGGDARYAFIAEGITMWFVGVPLAFLGALVLKLPVHWVAALVMFEEVAKAIAGIARLLSGRWIKNVINTF